MRFAFTGPYYTEPSIVVANTAAPNPVYIINYRRKKIKLLSRSVKLQFKSCLIKSYFRGNFVNAKIDSTASRVSPYTPNLLSNLFLIFPTPQTPKDAFFSPRFQSRILYIYYYCDANLAERPKPF